MEKILALLTEIKGYFTSGNATASAALAAAESTISDLNAQLATAQASATDLTAQLATAQAAVTAHSSEITTLQAALATEKNRANSTLAAQGLPLDQIPALTVGANLPGPSIETAWDKWQRLTATDPRAAGHFWATDAQNILNSRPA